jgi:hypothetical protein
VNQILKAMLSSFREKGREGMKNEKEKGGD